MGAKFPSDIPLRHVPRKISMQELISDEYTRRTWSFRMSFSNTVGL